MYFFRLAVIIDDWRDGPAVRMLGLADTSKITDMVDGPKGEGSSTSDRVQELIISIQKSNKLMVIMFFFSFIFLSLIIDIIRKVYGYVSGCGNGPVCKVMAVEIHFCSDR